MLLVTRIMHHTAQYTLISFGSRWKLESWQKFAFSIFALLSMYIQAGIHRHPRSQVHLETNPKTNQTHPKISGATQQIYRVKQVLCRHCTNYTIQLTQLLLLFILIKYNYTTHICSRALFKQFWYLFWKHHHTKFGNSESASRNRNFRILRRRFPKFVNCLPILAKILSLFFQIGFRFVLLLPNFILKCAQE